MMGYDGYIAIHIISANDQYQRRVFFFKRVLFVLTCILSMVLIRNITIIYYVFTIYAISSNVFLIPQLPRPMQPKAWRKPSLRVCPRPQSTLWMVYHVPTLSYIWKYLEYMTGLFYKCCYIHSVGVLIVDELMFFLGSMGVRVFSKLFEPGDHH